MKRSRFSEEQNIAIEKEQEAVNTRLKKLLAEAMPDNAMLGSARCRQP